MFFCDMDISVDHYYMNDLSSAGVHLNKQKILEQFTFAQCNQTAWSQNWTDISPENNTSHGKTKPDEQCTLLC